MKVTVIPIIAGSLGIVSEGKKKKVEELAIKRRIATIQTKTDIMVYLEESGRRADTCGHSSGKPPVKTDVKNSHE